MERPSTLQSRGLPRPAASFAPSTLLPASWESGFDRFFVSRSLLLSIRGSEQPVTRRMSPAIVKMQGPAEVPPHRVSARIGAVRNLTSYTFNASDLQLAFCRGRTCARTSCKTDCQDVNG